MFPVSFVFCPPLGSGYRLNPEPGSFRLVPDAGVLPPVLIIGRRKIRPEMVSARFRP